MRYEMTPEALERVRQRDRERAARRRQEAAEGGRPMRDMERKRERDRERWRRKVAAEGYARVPDSVRAQTMTPEQRERRRERYARASAWRTVHRRYLKLASQPDAVQTLRAAVAVLDAAESGWDTVPGFRAETA